MIRTTLFAAVLLGGWAAPVRPQSCPDPRMLTSGIAQPLATVRYLADDALEGRLAGSAGERCAGEYIAGQFRALGLLPGGDAASFFQNVKLASTLNPHAPSGTGRNVIGLLEGSDPQLRSEAIIVGAHYDHLGMGGFGSLAPDERAVHNGADDNASGVAALIEAARVLARGPRPARTVVFVAFTGEESGVIGSTHFAGSPAVGYVTPRAMLNMDMVGRLGTGRLIIYGVETAREWKDILVPATERAGIRDVTYRPEGYGPSDHTAFYTKDIPVLHFFTNVHTDYHRPSDDWEKVDAAGLATIARLVADVTRKVAAAPAFTLVRGVGQPPAAQPGAAEAGYGAYLGSIPDFTPVDYGVKLSGVRAGSPADMAGIKGGDIIVRFGDEETKDLYVMTAQLRKYKPGQTVRITVVRAGQELSLDVTLGSRGQ